MLIENAFVLIDQIDTRHREGKPPLTVVHDTAGSRLRPVSTAALTFATVLPPIVVPALQVTSFRIPATEESR